MWAGELIIRNLGHDGKPEPYGHIPVASSFAPNRAWKLYQVYLEVCLMVVPSEKQCDSSLMASGWDGGCLGKRAEGGRGARGPLTTGFDVLRLLWDASPFDVGNQLITSWNWFAGLGSSLQALLSATRKAFVL